MRVCFIVSEIFHWGYYGGFGALTRTLGSELAKKGIDVFVLMPQSSKDQRLIEKLDNMIIFGVPSKKHNFRLNVSRRSRFLKIIDADIYHSEEPSIATYVATKAEKKKKHIVTFQDPRDLDTVKLLWSFDLQGYQENPLKRLLLRYSYNLEQNLIRKGLQKADSLYCQAKYIIPKTISMYNLEVTPAFLPNPVRIPSTIGKKTNQPTVCFLNRWDGVKRPELFINLAKKFPDFTFIMMGTSRNQKRNLELIEMGRKIPNLQIPGFVTEEQKTKILEKSWIYVNSSIRECLPVAFLEAAANRCAILSSVNPDNFAEAFGYRVITNDLPGYAEGLEFLIENNRWKAKAEKGYRYVKEVHEMDKVIDQHIQIYRSLTE